MLILSFIGTKYAFERLPYARQYYAEKQPYLFIQEREKMPVDENGLTPLLQSLDTTMKTINILKKYNLSVYRYWSAYEASPSSVILDTVRFERGIFEDKWIESDYSFSYFASRPKKISLSFYNPDPDTEGKTIRILVDGKENLVLPLQYENFSTEVEIGTGNQTIEIKSNFTQKNDNGDIRKISVILSDIKFIDEEQQNE